MLPKLGDLTRGQDWSWGRRREAAAAGKSTRRKGRNKRIRNLKGNITNSVEI